MQIINLLEWYHGAVIVYGRLLEANKETSHCQKCISVSESSVSAQRRDQFLTAYVTTAK